MVHKFDNINRAIRAGIWWFTFTNSTFIITYTNITTLIKTKFILTIITSSSLFSVTITLTKWKLINTGSSIFYTLILTIPYFTVISCKSWIALTFSIIITSSSVWTLKTNWCHYCVRIIITNWIFTLNLITILKFNIKKLIFY